MRLLSYVFCLCVSIPSITLAAGSGGVSDLMFPAINFVILFGFIIFKYKRVISKGYHDKSVELENLLIDAAEADKQASIKLENLQKELSNIESVKAELKSKAKVKLEEQLSNINQEAHKKLEKLKKDTDAKFNQEKNSLVGNLNNRIIDLVIHDTKNIIQGDKDKRKATTKNLISSIQ